MSHKPESTVTRGAIAAGAGCFVLSIVYITQVFTRYLVNDDYQILYTAWLKSTNLVPGRDYAITSYHLLVDVLAPLFRLFPDSLVTLYLARIFNFVVLVSIAALLFDIARRLFGWYAGLTAPLLALGTGAMLHRGMDVRPDLLTTALWLFIIRGIMQPVRMSPARLGLLGLVAGLATVNRFKAGIVIPFLAVGILLRVAASSPHGRLRHAISSLAIAAGAAAGVLCLYALLIFQFDDVYTFVKTHLALARDISHSWRGDPRWRTLSSALALDPIFWLLSGSGLVLALLRSSPNRPWVRETSIGLVALSLVSILSNPAYYAYNLVTLIPLCAPLAAAPFGLGLEALARAGSSRCLAIATPILLSISVLQQPLILDHYLFTPTNRHQKALVEFIRKSTRADAAVFAFEGVGLFRPSTRHWRISEIILNRYYRGEFTVRDELCVVKPELIVASYRVPAWLTAEDKRYLEERFVPLSFGLLVPGHIGEGEFELMVDGQYEAIAWQSQCRFDGEETRHGEVLNLTAGIHRIEGENCAVRRYYPASALVDLNPKRLPYLVPPELTTFGGGW